MYKSEVRDSVIDRMFDKVRKERYNRYLKKVRLAKCRAFNDELIRFDFPVTALIGPNGGGKTTILGACALLYKGVEPRRFFARNNQLDKGMRDWSISYEAIDREVNNKESIRRSARFSSEKWSRKALERDVVILGVSRTLPAVERSNLSRFTNKNVSFKPEEITELNGSADYITKILGKDVSGYKIAKSDKYGNIQFLSGETGEGKTYSEFHFGAGESSIIKMVLDIEHAPDNSLILIEEIENGLHPLATSRLVEYLIDAADRKKLQIVFTTHSEYAIRPLPDEAVWAAIEGKAIQGKLDILSLRSLVGEVSSELVIYTEDLFAKEWVLTMLRTRKEIATDAIGIYPMGGDVSAVKANKYHNQDPSRGAKSICVIDGDSQQEETAEGHVFRLPGEVPEMHIINEILDVIDECAGALAMRCMHKFSEEKRVADIIKSVKNTNHDHHLIFSQIGEKLGYISEVTVRDAFLTTWCEQYIDQVDSFLDGISEHLPMVRGTGGMI